MRRVVIIGGGLSGLSAAYDLSRQDVHVTLLEAAPDFGGLASSFRLHGQPVERFYHFICRSDSDLLKLVDEFKLQDKLHWRAGPTSFYYNGKRYPFSKPLDLLNFSAVSWTERMRFGLHVLHSKYRENWRHLDRIPAKQWLIECLGEHAYNVIWHPLLRVKFGLDDEVISAAWMWHRIWRVANSRDSVLTGDVYGCLEHGTATLVDPMVDLLAARPNVVLRSNVKAEPLVLRDGRVVEVRAGGESYPCDAVISTVALPALGHLVPGVDDEYFTRVRRVRYLGVVCMVLSVRHSLSPNFWTNVNDPRVSFNGIIEQTALNQNLHAAGLNVIYIPYYLPTSAPRYSATPEALFEEYVPMMQIVNPQFSRDDVREWHVFRNPYAQPIFETGFLDLMPDHRTSVGGFYITDSTQFYPEDRTISAAIRQGRTVARMVREDLSSSA